ncbi:hypothetical protein BJF85_18720 [Saccharomonospora sp. CUA-673]|uniref:septum formation family protein n=1 Tax=Saccharomonospora sp. CUA-673 TaxID=1904969 RepID=UPI00095BA627|nr:septum formation family protein [Saccharomonospora sp. CUA-673]OLT45502.1 hypothetical protein BJF85_18720 [Saccharomonospora sp. CUA-673]
MSGSGRIALAVSALAAALVLAGCADPTSGLAEPDLARATDAPDAPQLDDLPNEPAHKAAARTIVAGTGECLDSQHPGPVDCAEPHTVEVTKEGTFGGDLAGALTDTPPDDAAVFNQIFPQCRQAAADYLGSDAYDASTLGAWLVWADADDWKAGNRWYRCGVAELDGDGQAQTRSGSVRGALAEDFGDYRLCSTTRPSAELPRPVPCEESHVAEAVGVVGVGAPDSPPPSEREFDAKARNACGTKVTEYVGEERRDVAPSWRWPDEINWRNGFTNITCYAEFQRPTSGSAQNPGSPTSPN